MAIIPTVGRKSWSSRITIALLYIVLSAGVVTMVYPFLLMLATSVTSNVDVNEHAIVPRYFWDEDVLFAKYADDKYQSDLDTINHYYGTDFVRLEVIHPPDIAPDDPKAIAIAQDWWEFQDTVPSIAKQPCFQGMGKGYAKLRRMYQEWLRERFDDDIEAVNEMYLEENDTFLDVFLPFERHQRREWQPDDSPKMRDWLEYKATLPREFLQVGEMDSPYYLFLQDDKYDGSINQLNEAYGTRYREFSEIHLTPYAPEHPVQRADWEEFVRTRLPFRYMEVDDTAAPAYQAFLRERYQSIQRLNSRRESNYSDFADIGIPKELPAEGPRLTDWMEFVSEALPISSVRAVNVENQYRDYLLGKFGSADGINAAYGTDYSNILGVRLPIHIADWVYAHNNTRQLRIDFLTRNYKLVIEYIALHGRALLNTFIFVTALILTSLIVNPLCAYALSRYNLKYSYKVLLFLLATMAFPAEVALIPNFLLLKQFQMLNTYWALVLPGMASGFSIFLLKGFFDSLPKELYEAGLIDGASEARMFFRITLPLSKPIFAVIALQSFTAAYGAFMFALLVCQDPRMWTLMVWLYQLQIGAPQFVTMAALTLAAIPTLVVFIFAQNVIMRGIIIPSFK